MRLSYAIEGHGAGHSTVATAEDAARVVDRALRVAHSSADPTALASLMHRVMGPLRMAMVTDGARAVSLGREWESHSGGVLVRLAP